MVCIDIVVLDQCCCAKNIVGWLWVFCFCFFIELRTKINLSSIIILWYISGLQNQRFKFWCYHWNQTKLFQAVMQENARNSKLLEDELRNRPGNVYKSADSSVTQPEPELRSLFTVATAQTHFLFNGSFYDQIDGVAMGSPLAPVLANLFVGHHEKLWLENFRCSKIYF